MTTKENVTLHICDFCNKKLFVKSAMVRHEKNCIKNPENIDACLGCMYCEKRDKTYTVEADIGMYAPVIEARQSTGFSCKKLNQLMYPQAAVRKGVVRKYPEMFKDEIQMPRECEHFKHEIEEFF